MLLLPAADSYENDGNKKPLHHLLHHKPPLPLLLPHHSLDVTLLMSLEEASQEAHNETEIMSSSVQIVTIKKIADDDVVATTTSAY